MIELRSRIRTTYISINELLRSPATVAFLILCALALLSQNTTFTTAREDLMMRLDPTAARAYSYGESHFDAMDPREYDLARATRFFKWSKNLDPLYPLTSYELARIAFLQGDLQLALTEINLEFKYNPHPISASYYVRALIKGYLKDYAGAAADYESYFKVAPANWAGINDYSWVLLKADLPEAALAALDWGLTQWPENPWLLNNKTTALYELGRYQEAAQSAASSTLYIQKVTVPDWLMAYPGNDPLIAPQGLAQFKQAVADNQRLVQEALRK